MRRLRRSVLPEKQRKKGFFSKIRKRNKDPTVEVDNHASSDNAVGVEESHAFNDWYRLLQLINILCTLYMVGRHVYTITFRWGVFYPGKQTYFTPAPWAFYTWPVIHVLMLGNCIYQFSHQERSILDGWKLPLLHISNGLYIRCWSTQRYKYAFVCIVVTYMVVNRIYRKISKIPSRDIRDWFFCHLLFSLYHAWVLGLMFLGAFEAFGVDAATTPAQGGTEVSVLFSLMLIQLFEWAYASPATEEQSARSEFVHWITLVSTIFSLYWIAQCMVGLERTIRKLARNPGTAGRR
ncbi:hypothetical protein JVT61DRAFT_7541 [Boletus reticuloceps]|uniref:Transmembrane protein n=1 Tax=Boletus reticuloceps TaxID=495285 RepID=A0A8I2YHN2_9AGAM|nr:hypothetical protein JVT61DRAFT_7541 [Boletus reticuloceps]